MRVGQLSISAGTFEAELDARSAHSQGGGACGPPAVEQDYLGTDERVVILEDTRELRCSAADSVALRTRPGEARDLSQQGVDERGLAGGGAADNEDILALGHRQSERL